MFLSVGLDDQLPAVDGRRGASEPRTRHDATRLPTSGPFVDNVRMVRYARAAAGLLAAVLAAGCSSRHVASGAQSPAPTTATVTATASTGVSLADECTSAIAYWTGQALTPGADQGYDYQEMGLSAVEYQILQDVISLARPVARASGLSAVQAFAERTARPRCVAYLAAVSASPSASGRGWPQ